MASPVAAYPNSAACSSKKTSASIELIPWLDIPALLTNSAVKATIDCVVFIAILVALFMVPA